MQMKTEVFGFNAHGKLKQIINFVLILANSSFAFGLLSTISFDTLVFQQKALLILPALALTAFMVVKEFRVQSLKKRLGMNLFICLGFILTIFGWYLIW